jgi:tetratricopeptide (TPR) repeat protein
LLARTGDFGRADAVAEEFRQHLSSARDTLRHAYAVASIGLSRGNLLQAVAGFEKAAEDTVIPYTPANCMLAQAYFGSERWVDGIAELEKLKSDFTETKLYYGSWVVKTHYTLGLAHEELGHTDLAIGQYQIFLDLWKHADPGIAEVEDARERLTRLKSKS